MRQVTAILLIASAAASSAYAALPSQALIETCLTTHARHPVKAATAFSTDVYDYDDYRPGYHAFFYQQRGKDIGIAERMDRQDNDDVEDDALIYAGVLYPLQKATHTDFKSGQYLPRINFGMSDWLLLEANSHRYLCVGSNFEGIGRSGAHQYVRFGYLLSLTGPKTLYWFWGDVRQRWRPR